MLRRSPEAVAVAHAMDHSRKELYVEGQRDRLFLSWLLGRNMNVNTSVREINFVDLPTGILGGERGRLIYFANWLGTRATRIRMFADADWDRLLTRPVPERIWLTDHRDMEGYVLSEKCLDKVLRLGVGTDAISAEALLANVREVGRLLGLVRLMSERDALGFPFRRTQLERHLDVHACQVSLDLEGYLRALLQNAGISLARLGGLKDRLAEVEPIYASIPDSEIIHGKDAMCILEVALSRFEIDPRDVPRLMWTSFEASFVVGGSTLDTVAGFLRDEH